MKMKFLSLAVAAAVIAPSAMADVTVYGKLHMSIDSVDLDSGNYDGQAITSRASRLGFKGSEDLGNGLKAIWKLEYTMAMDAPSNGLGGNARDHYLGLAGNFGSVMLAGRMNTPYKNSTGKLDFFGDTLADYNSTLGFEDNRGNNAIAYISPKFGGLKFAAMTMAGESTATSGPTAGSDGLFDAYSLALSYDNAGIMGAIAYEDMEDLGKTGQKFRIGLGYKMNAFKVAAVYEDQSDRGGVSGADGSLWQISGAYTMGNNTIKAMYGENEFDGFTDKSAWALGVDHKMSKRTKVYALYTDSGQGLHNESSSVTDGRGEGISLGMVHSF